MAKRTPEPIRVGISRDDWLKALHEVQSQPLQPSDAVSVVEFAAMMDLSRSQAYKRLCDLVTAGKAQITRKQVARVSGGRMFIPAYRLVK